jgi:hypothetical protein
MNTVDFLRLVTPEYGQKAAVVPRGKNKDTGKPLWYHFVHEDHDSLAWRINTLTDTHVYYALGGFKHGAIQEYSGRKQDNVEYLRAFWMDIDVERDNPKKYSTKSAAGAAVASFVAALGLPEPLVVVSGSGLHAYWPLTQDIIRQEWKPIAQALKLAAQAHGLLVDHSRTSDEASILRPVGTLNNKTIPAKPVVAIEWSGTPVQVGVIAAALRATQPLILPIGGFDITNELGVALASTTTNKKIFQRVMAKCPQIQWAYDHMQYGPDGLNAAGDKGEKVAEPVWKACLSVISRCENGERHAHTFSKPYPVYTIHETQAKYIQEAGKDMPANCTTFHSLNPGPCVTCPHFGRIKSPVILGIEHVELPPPDIKIAAEVVVAAPEVKHGFTVTHNELRIAGVNPPFPYKRTDKGLVKIAKVPAIGEDGIVVRGSFVEEERKFADYDIYPLFRTREYIDGVETVHYNSYWRIIPANKTAAPSDVLVTHTDLASDDSLKRVLYDKAVYSAGATEHKEVAEYMRSFMKQLGEAHTHPQPQHFGWQSDVTAGKPLNEQALEFVTGRSRIMRKKVSDKWVVETDPIVPSNAMLPLAAALQPHGTLEGWSEAASWYTDEHTPYHISALLLSAGSVFMRYTKGSGIITMLKGRRGSGKSYLLDLAASIWGTRKGYIRGGVNSAAGIETLAALLQSLPVIADDRTEMPREQISAEIMMLANGTGKGRGKSINGDVGMGDTKSWLSNALMSSNHSWVDLMNSVRIENEGQTGRIIEIDTPPVPSHAWPISGIEGERRYQALVQANAGVAGPAVLTEFLRDPDMYIQKLVLYENTLTETIVGLSKHSTDLKGLLASDFRLQTAAAACALLFLYILRKLGLVKWGLESFVKVMLEVIANIARVTKENRPTQADILSQYINEFHGNFVVVTSESVRLGGMTAPLAGEQAFGKVPNNRIVGRLDNVAKVVQLERASFKTWLTTKGVSEEAVIKGLEAEGWEVKAGQNIRATLGRGFPNTNRMQSRVIELRNESLIESLTSGDAP